MIAPPASVQELGSLLKGHSKENQSLIFQRIITCNHVSLSGGNKKKVRSLHLALLRCIRNRIIHSTDGEIFACSFAVVWSCLQW